MSITAMFRGSEIRMASRAKLMTITSGICFPFKAVQPLDMYFDLYFFETYPGLTRTGGLLFIPDLAVEEVSHVFRAAFYS